MIGDESMNLTADRDKDGRGIMMPEMLRENWRHVT